MFFCSFLINDSTKERSFQRKHDPSKSQVPILYVVQPGNQVVADQTFNSFLFSSSTTLPFSYYITSWRKPNTHSLWFEQDSGSAHVGHSFLKSHAARIMVFAAISITMIGFILQFVGLRAMHSAVSLLQLGVTLLMSIIRALLRTQRLRKEQNILRDRPDEVSGHELDWLALQIGKEPDGPRSLWCVTPGTTIQVSGEDTIPKDKSNHALVYSNRSRLSQLTQQSAHTKSKLSNAWDDKFVVGRLEAKQLSKAIGESLEILFAYAKPKGELKDEGSIHWHLHIRMWDEKSQSQSHVTSSLQASTSSQRLLPHSQHTSGQDSIVISIRKKSSAWTIDPNDLEAVLGLWSWSITSDPQTEEDTFELKTSNAAEVPMYRITSAEKSTEAHAHEDLRFWAEALPETSMMRFKSESSNGLNESPETIWESEPSGEGGIQFKKLMLDKVRSSDDGHIDDRRYRRLFGWQIANKPEYDSVSAIKIASKSIPAICCQDIYQSFLCAIASQFELDEEKMRVARGNGKSLLEHQTVTKLIDCFEANGLGSRQDAYPVVILALKYGSSLPLGTKAIPGAHQDAENYRKDGKFDEAEELLKWAWGAASTSDESKESTMLELGELYRYAFFSGDDYTRNIGKSGIEWMSQQEGSPALEEINSRYSKLIHEQSSHSRTGQDVLRAIKEGNRTEALLSISLLRNKDLSYSEGKEKRTALSWAAQRGWTETVKAVLEIGSVVDFIDAKERTPLSYAAEYGHSEVVQVLMNANALPIRGDSEQRAPLAYAVANGHVLVVETLLKDPRVTVYATYEKGSTLLHVAAKTGHKHVIGYLLNHGCQSQINDGDSKGYTPLVVALLNHGRSKNDRLQTAALLLEEGANPNITVQGKEAWQWALSEGEWVCAELLLDCSKAKGTIGVVLKVGPPYVNFSGSELRNLEPGIKAKTYNAYGEEIEPTSETLCKAVSHNYAVFVSCSDNFTTTVHDPEPVVRAMVYCLEDKSQITPKVITTAMRQSEPMKMLPLLLSLAEQASIAEEVLTEAAKSEGNGEEILAFLLARYEEHIAITENVVKAAAKNQKSGQQIMTLLFDRGGEQVKITEEILKAAAGNENKDIHIMELLLDRRGDQVIVTEEILKMAVGNFYRGKEITELLLDRRGDQVIVTEEILKVAAASSEGVMGLLLDRRGDQVIVTEEILKVAAGNGDEGNEIMELLLDRRGDQVILTEEILKVAAGRSKWVMELLLD
ncbi:hypothetical protein GGR54DRAFT_647395 [Hypoxylon sp. NC1633]|nr:hypothetical protein GGR54DRAFT_647395 [Hypoxylon sp. NC1633]